MHPHAALLPLALGIAALCAAAAAATAAGPDLHIEVSLVPASGQGLPVATQPVRAVALISNLGAQDAGSFEVDITAKDSNDVVLLGRHSLNVTSLPAGANLSLEDPTAFTVALAGDVLVSATADPAHRINDTRLVDNFANRTVYIGPPPVARTVEELHGRAAGNRTLPPYSFVAFRVELRDGDALIFQADSEPGALFDCYLLDAANYTRYEHARESNESPIFMMRDYSRTATDHLAYSAEPLPPGIYYLVLENDERLASGASPTGPVTINYAVAIVNNSLPSWAVLVVVGAAAAAIYATIRWRPHFDVRSPLLAVPPPDPEEVEGEGDPPGPHSGLIDEEPDPGDTPPHPL